ncbi:hypothetical protein ABET51_07910 [Metabacillus fastidiosus]|uniref:hypothetical protein n=1 Tax=Metabacillus fastidiosus TaxID=1458 RepID=UPI003D29546B
MNYVNNFLQKIREESPQLVQFSIGQQDYEFTKINPSFSEGALLRYEGRINPMKQIKIEIRHTINPNTNFNRLETHAPGKSAQLTCFHFGQLEFVSGKLIIDISQIVKFSGQNAPVINLQKKEATVAVLDAEGLIISEENRAPRWYLGTFNNETQQWIYGKGTTDFISNFLKVSLIMGHFRGNRDIELVL